MTRRLLEGSAAMAEAAIAAGCRFFAGYPMTPFTELLESFARRLPEVGGVCINAESELESIGMAWGALATGARAATGSTGQGLALMQESLSEITRAELPLVVFHMARGQADYTQATRGGGHGDYHHLVLAPIDVGEATRSVQLAFDLADRWRNPVTIYGDYLLAHTAEAVEIERLRFEPLPPKEWAVDGSLGGSGRSRNLNPIGMVKGRKGIEPESFWKRLQAKHDEMARREARFEAEVEHDLCPGCGEPLALRCLLEAIEELGCGQRAIGVVGIGCYTALGSIMDVDLIQALHGRAPSVATGAKRMRPDALLFTLQGDGDMVNEGLQEVIHTAARGEAVTCVLLNNGVFGETGGHMTSTTVLGQRTKNTLDGRDAAYHGHPIRIADLLAQLDGTVYAARASVHDAAGVAKTRRVLRRALETQLEGKGFSFVEILTMCPTGWFVPTAQGPDYLSKVLGSVYVAGELKRDGRFVPTAELAAHR